MSSRPHDKIGLALGSGAARGLAHIGVLKVLEEAKVPIAAISGTSIGALIGALYAAGVSVAQMEEIAREVDWRDLARLVDPVFPGAGLIDGKKVSRFIAELLPVQSFEELRFPFAVTATDVETGEDIFIKQGNLLEAVRAAISFPGIFTPVRFGSRFLVDGGLCNPVPVDVARELGSDKVIGVCAIPAMRQPHRETYLEATPEQQGQGSWREIFTAQGVERLFREIWPGNGKEKKPAESPPERERKPPGLLKIFTQSIAIMENQINDLRLAQNHIDLLLRPHFDGFNLFEFNRAEEAIRAGEAEARKRLPAIMQMCGRD
ncbi:patatin-like phospholipase RssA [Desulfuromonas carbonis]|uniref:patatin-like phospholipase family protein n=1 Tax=Desulfuromonas sp. DDH964 TaxID=1823759 RepID=UPI00078E2602|nr:patatin-like phospholipase family protein [Desulfuromonas sp. DDH964]AMV72998.1 phospholipase, patatin family [Desulfuromonas sp. DDH964]